MEQVIRLIKELFEQGREIVVGITYTRYPNGTECYGSHLIESYDIDQGQLNDSVLSKGILRVCYEDGGQLKIPLNCFVSIISGEYIISDGNLIIAIEAV